MQVNDEYSKEIGVQVGETHSRGTENPRRSQSMELRTSDGTIHDRVRYERLYGAGIRPGEVFHTFRSTKKP